MSLFENNFWIALTIIAVISLIVFFGKKNSVWGGLTLGIIIGIIIAIFKDGFQWSIILRSSVIATVIGTILELPSKLKKKFK